MALPKQVETVRDMMTALEQEIADAKSGNLPLETARVVLKARDLQLKAAQLNIAHARLHRHQQKVRGIDRNLLTGEVVEAIPPAAEPIAEKIEVPEKPKT